MIFARLDMAALRALLIGVLCIAVMAFRAGGLSSEGILSPPNDPAAVSVAADHHRHGHSHDDEPVPEGDASHHENHAADHSHDTPGNPAFTGFRTVRVTGSEPHPVQLSEVRERPSGIDRPPREALAL